MSSMCHMNVSILGLGRFQQNRNSGRSNPHANGWLLDSKGFFLMRLKKARLTAFAYNSSGDLGSHVGACRATPSEITHRHSHAADHKDDIWQANDIAIMLAQPSGVGSAWLREIGGVRADYRVNPGGVDRIQQTTTSLSREPVPISLHICCSSCFSSLSLGSTGAP